MKHTTCLFCSFDVICRIVFLQSALQSAERTETVFNLFFDRGICGVEDEIIVFDLDTVAESEIFAGQCHKKGQGCIAVSQHVEDIEHYAPAVSADTEHIATVFLEVKSVKAVKGRHFRSSIKLLKIPPESSVGERVSEMRYAPYCRFKG